ncbi:hypothetical protein ACHQM5_028886 [Ranunculus cassubicifolius]
MSIDGSFNLQSAISRFLNRCGNLKSNPRFNSLLLKGDKVKESEVVSAISELFLHKRYTIPIIGCFRPILRSIVEKTVELLLLVPVLGLSLRDGEGMEIDDDDNDGEVIEKYVRSGRSVELNEMACLAFSRALDLAPFLLQPVLRYFKSSSPPFQRLLQSQSASQLVQKDGAQLLDAVRVSFRLLLIEPQVFSELWDWSSFLDLVQQSTDVSGEDSDHTNIVLDIRWCAVQILSITLKMSDRASTNFGLDAEKSLACFFRWEEFCQDVSLEKAGFYLDPDLQKMGKDVDAGSEFNIEYCLKSFKPSPLNSSLLQSCKVESPRKSRRHVNGKEDPLECPFFLTSAVKKSFEMVLMAVSQKWPVLLNGPTGSGKTAVVNYLAKVSGNRVLSIHMDEQMDGKTLIGSYVCTEKPGEFRWQPGSLTQAITNGFWVVFEDIDKAPSDVQSILLPLLEGANSFVTGRGEAIGVSDSFRLFATVSTFNPDGKNSLGVLWRSVMISPAADEGLLNIIKEWYPELEAMAKNILETYECVTSSHLHHLGASHSYNRFSLRNLLKWCKRIVSLESLYAAHGLSAHERKCIYQEAVDIFVAYSGSSTNRLYTMREIAKIWGVPAEEAETLYPRRKPSIQELKSEFQIGRVSLKLTKNVVHNQTRPFVDIGSSLHVLERIACSVKHNEPVLLVGETGTGKTTLVQNLANRIGQPLVVLNLSQQSDIADLLGGLKPTDPQFLCVPLYNEFIELLPRTFSKTRNDPILQYLKTHRDNRNWKKILEALQKGYEKVLELTQREPVSGKRKRPMSEELLKAWELFSEKLNMSRRQIDASSGIAFSFVEGAFVTALRKGHWILLDEINLAPPETLQRIMGVLEGENGSLCLTERGDIDYIKRHRDFRVFACMNPATDAGKRDLPFSLRGRFTEYFVDEILDEGELTLFINQFVDDSCPDRTLVNKIVQFYLAAKRLSEERLQDGANQKPQFSLRSLYRALEYVKKAQRNFGYVKALYDGFCMFFLTLLDESSAKVMNEMICKKLLEGSVPRNVPYDSYLVVAESSKSDPSVADYILTDSVKEHLRNLARAVLIKRYPILLQGPTSSGKTSLVRHLAAVTGHEFVRINNHEHTDLQEYLGSYITDATGKLVFQEGVLVKAVRSGCWIVLDELNLAPSDVLEALNRLLDDNRELFVPELQETIKAHPNFMLFATQNPPTLYGGRKMLSRAFRNRFVEIHVGEIPENELTTILKERCKIPESYARKMVNVMKDLQLHRQSSKVFAGKHGFITPRDLFRWADRYRELGNSCEDLVKDGYYLLAERLRDEKEKNVVREVLLKIFRPVKLEEADLYKEGGTDFTTQSTCNGSGVLGNHGRYVYVVNFLILDSLYLALLSFSFGIFVLMSLLYCSIIWTKSMQRLYFLVERCYKLREPVLLVGETAGGKTTVCQLLSTGLGRTLHILNCHQFTETSDFLGGFYPVRDRSVLIKEFKDVLEKLMLSNVVQGFPELTLSSDIGQASGTLAQLNDITDTYQRGQIINTNITRGDLDTFEQMKLKLIQLHQKWQTIFTWHDGPLVETMKSGDLFLVDEISLADDSVLERLNSVLEPERKLWFSQLHISRMLTVRDLLSWVEFMNATVKSFKSPNYAFLHGAFLVLLDGLSLGDDDCKPEGFEFLSPTTCRNAMRVLRAMQLTKPGQSFVNYVAFVFLLLEGSPGVGKTSLIVALGKFSGHRVVRINLSEQTDIMDLLGSDFPVEDAEGMKFAWSDGILLQGLNAILDHRAEVFIPELGQTYRCPPSFRVFACQNPSCQGGGRKGLPKSFLNRFTKVYVDELVEDDYLYICKSLHPSIPEPLLRNLICFNKRLYMDTMISRKYGLDGSPWEFNLRDVIRSCQIMEGSSGKSKADCFLSIVYIQRMRTATDRQEVVKLYEEVFGVKPNINTYPAVHINPRYLIVGNTFVERNHLQSRPSEITKSQLKLLPGIRYSLEAVAHCVQYQWLCILVGPTASGKTSLIRLLAHLSGHVLHELNLSSATDISELLGCFEQYNAYRSFRSAMSQLENFIDEFISLSLESSSETLVFERKGLVSRWFTFLSSTYGNTVSKSTPACAESWNAVSDSSLSSLIQIIEELKSSAARYHLPVSWSLTDLNEVLKSVIKLSEHTKKKSFSAKFEWVTGILINAIERGEWIVLENANLCNPTVLDRINSLVEPSGSITINECGLVDGRPVVLCPNKKFRLFLTVNPKFGEVSRAMRNRGVEVFMMQPDWIYHEEGGYNRKGTDVYEVKRFLVMSGIPLSLLVEMMTEAHIYARNAGVNLGVQITLVELTRWVQLFQQLLVNGNRPLWSLQVSWEHTYLSSLGEFEGRSAVEHVKNSYLSGTNLSKLDDFLIYSLSLPGGWPTHLKLRNFVWNSTGTCVKQNCMYLKYLADQFASYEVSCAHYRTLALKQSSASNGDTLISVLDGNNDISPSLLSLNKILHILFPIACHEPSSLSTALQKFDLTVFSKMIIFSANWVIEQATEGDLKLYLLWFSQYSNQLAPYCRLFESYLNILKKESVHPIWTSIFDSRRELISHYEIDVDTQTLPLLSLNILDATSSDGTLQSVRTRLRNSVKCIDLLRHTLQQWNVEDEHNHLEGNHFSPVLESLRELEKEVLNKLVDSPSFELLFGIYSNVIEHHSLLWDGILSSKYESMIISWRSLKKDARKLLRFFPKAVKDLLVQSSMAVNMSPWNCQSTKSMLWAYGGHPFLPSSADTYSLMEELLKFCRLVWPTGVVSWNQASAGVAMSSLIIIKDDQDEASLVQKLQEMHQILMGRFEYEKQKLKADLVSKTQTSKENYLSDCCLFCPEKLHKKISFSSWLEMFDLFDSTSFFFDMELLREFSCAILLEGEQLHEAISNNSELLRTSMDYSLKFSSRSPTDFIPHQTLLWVLDAWKSVDSVRTKVASSILEMWFKWHSLLWMQHHDPFKIIYAHEKSFEKEKYAEIKSIFGSIQRCDEKVEKLQSLRILISSTSNKRLLSVMDSSVTPLLSELYVHSSTLDSLENLGRAWLHIGSLRFHLLLTPDDLDPAIKYSIRHSQIVEKISVLELEIKVREECEDLVGRVSNNDVLQQRRQLIDTLEAERRRIKRKVVYRHDSSQFTRLKSECADFFELTVSSSELAKNMTTMSVSQFMNKAFNWQETATSFIHRLSDEYSAYADIIQPVQVAVYEMKLGLSLVLSSALQKMFLAKMEERTSERIEEAIYCFTQFPRGFSVALNYSDVNKGCLDFPTDEDLSAGILALDLNLLEKIFTISRDNISDKALSVPQSHAALCHNIFVRLVHVIVNSQLISHKSFKLLQQIFDKFAGLWMSMKIQTKEKEENDARSYKFKTRHFKIEDILDVEVSSLQNFLSDDCLRVEWKEMMEEEESSAQPDLEEHENLEKEWSIIQESILDSMVLIHNQFFGSRDLVADLGFNQISDAEKLSSFRDSYKLGLRMLKGVPGLLSSSLDAKLVPEHLLSACLEYDEKFGRLHHPVSIHNIYKDSNASLLSKMVNPLLALQHRVQSLLHEWPDHPGLQKILDLVEMLLAIPMSTPLAKVLSGLQFLFTKAHQLQENAPKLSLSDLMQPLLDLGLAWLRMEIESWPALLDGVQEQYEINSRKLWFPLYSVLYRGQSSDIFGDIRSTIQSLEEFMQTSSIGEFQRRLQLLLAFHGQISTALKFDSIWSLMAVTGQIKNEDDLEKLTTYMEHMKKILYNVFGYYVQFLPVVLEHIKDIRKSISKELGDIVKLSRWDRADNYLLMDSTKRLRQKLKKHIQKFNDVLQQSVMVILNKEAEKGGIVAQSEVKMDTERSQWYTDWRKKADFALEYCSPNHISSYNLQYLSSEDSKETEGFIRSSLSNQSVSPIYSDEWKGLWISLEDICRTITECGDLWEIEKKSIGKRRALSDLLKLLESFGLSRRTSIVSEDVLKSNQPRSWFLQPSYHVQHLLLPSTGNTTVDGGTSSSLFQMPLHKNSNANWKVANEYYFRSMAMVQLLRQICLNFHKDLSLDQVTRSAAFLEHLITVQQEQRSFAYTFSEDLKNTRDCIDLFAGLHTKPSVIDNVPNSESSVSLKQDTLRKFMWHQKKLFDVLYAISHETSLLLRNVEVTHLNTCRDVRVEANSLLALIEKFIPSLRKSKDSLDQYLLGGNRILTTSEAFLRPLIVSKKMEELVKQNFHEISELGDRIQAFFEQDVDRSSVGHHLIGRFVDILNKAKMTMQEFFSVLESGNQAITAIENVPSSESEAVFAKSFNRTVDLIREVFQKLGAESNGVTYSEDSVSVNITRWKVLAEAYRENIKLDRICKQLGETITSAVHLIDHAGTRNPNICCQVQRYLNYLHVLVDPILTLGEDFLLEFLTMHKTVGEMTHMLAKVFASLFSKGFGGPQADDTMSDAPQELVPGTGMSEGKGEKDVSDQLESEDQLERTSEKPDEEQDTKTEPPAKEEQGIEMENDFKGEENNLSEDSEDDEDNGDGEDEKLESTVGDTGENDERVDEKPWDKDDDDNPDTKNEQNETGPSMKDLDSGSNELRAKEDTDEPGDADSDKDNRKEENQNDPDVDEEIDDMDLDNEVPNVDPAGVQMDEPNQEVKEDTNMEDPDDTKEEEPQDTEEIDLENHDGTPENENDEDNEETEKENTESGKVDECPEGDETMKDQNEVADMDLSAPSKETYNQGESNFTGNSNSGMQLNAETLTSESSMSELSNVEEMQRGLAPSIGLPSSSTSETQLTMPDSMDGGKLTADNPKPESSQDESKSMERANPNPYRSVGDALEKWKERVKVSVDAEENNTDVMDEGEGEDKANEYGFVPESEKGTSQALGPATSEQIDHNIKGSNNPEGDEDLPERKEDTSNSQKHDSEILPSKVHNAASMQKLDEEMQNSDLNDKAPLDETLDDKVDIMSKDLVSVKKSYMDEEISLSQLNNLTIDDEEFGKAKTLEMSTDFADASALWRKYEQTTTRLSQELAEQLRLVMEPTVASKLQGDYKTGKRINMKKVIAYIASHYRKDKIWLRRTRPNKRDYQVVVAVDDSRSMSESHCGDVAIEALVTVCRAMSQLEVAQLAVASFGTKGNIKLLHDFDQHFTGESGMKMISSLKFEQENTIEDKPVLDLLMYLNNKLDSAETNSRLPSGQSPLQQLVLIISDGFLHEKERVKRYVRDLLSKNRMVAFLIIDPKDTITHLPEISIEEGTGKMTTSKYLNSFPFPYYIVLKDIEALPRTLADLLRQWFELMQSARD